MPTNIDLDQLDELLANGAQLVEVLPEQEYAEEHLPSAINLPLRNVTADGVQLLDTARPAIVYCWDSL